MVIGSRGRGGASIGCLVSRGGVQVNHFFGILVSPAPWEGLRLLLAWNIPSKQRVHFLPDIAPGNTAGRRHARSYILGEAQGKIKGPCLDLSFMVCFKEKRKEEKNCVLFFFLNVSRKKNCGKGQYFHLYIRPIIFLEYIIGKMFNYSLIT